MDLIKDAAGRVIGSVEKQGNQTLVRDDKGKVAGFTDSRGTFDQNSGQVSPSNMPGLLFGKNK